MNSTLQTSVKSLVGILAAAVVSFGLRAEAETYSGKVVSVTDGDSMTVIHNGAKEKVILFGVDCPEQGQEFGPEAKKFTDDYCYGKGVQIDARAVDPKGRTIAVVFLPDGTNLNVLLLQRGLAWWSDKFAPNEKEFQKLQQTAREQHAGLWSASNPIPPWIFRNGDRSVQAEIKSK